MKIPLFDLDKTLVEGDVTPYDQGCNYALSTVYHIPGKKTDIVTHGKIDNEIFIKIAKLHGVDEGKIIRLLPKAVRTMGEYFLRHANEGQYPLPGAIELLTELKKQGTKIGVLTGNMEVVALERLKRSGFENLIDFGAFGDLALRRVDLIEIARKRASKKFGYEISKEELVIIGDAQRDMECAKERRILAIGVTTGAFSERELYKAGADLVIPSLLEEQKILDFLEIS